jgi:hypothetical protein
MQQNTHETMASLRACAAAACLSAVAVAQSEFLINNLPGWAGSQTMYSGYIDLANSQRSLFFWLVESSNASADLVM